MSIPVTLLQDFERIPRDRPVALLMRHSARYPIIDPAETYLVPLTPEGVQMASDLGALIAAQRPIGRLFSSPVGRCIATAEAIARGAGSGAALSVEERLSHPTVEPAWDAYCRGELNGGALPGPAADVLRLAVDLPGDAHRLDILVTHDTVVGTLVGCLLGEPVMNGHWPGFLEGVFFWQADGCIETLWRGRRRSFPVELVFPA